ncbi:PadR family transcriptional regulator [Gemmatimonadota bacterium]
MAGVRAGNLYGTLELLILHGLNARGPMHGVAVADHIARRSGNLFHIEEGSLYPALHRLQAKGHVTWTWMKTGEGKRAKYYELTPTGRKALAGARQEWIRSTRAMFALLDVAWEDVR